MNTHFLLTVVFVAGVSAGWLGKTWVGSVSSELADKVSDTNPGAAARGDNETNNISPALNFNISDSNNASVKNIAFTDESPAIAQQYSSPGKAAVGIFSRLLNDRLYDEAMLLYEETVRLDQKTAVKLKSTLVDHLSNLSTIRNNTDFSELIERYLSIYYDDIDVLLLLAEFNQKNGSYLEAVDVYLLAKTYVYTDIDENNLLIHFNEFVKEIDSVYTIQKDWFSLVNFYSHINASGLMTSSYQYRQALAYLGFGDKAAATDHFKQLVDDSLVGEQASLALSRLSGNAHEALTTDNAIHEISEKIALQQRGSQYLIDLTVGREDTVKLLIDTGASMTTLSQASFYSLRSSADAVVQEKRMFRTANGVVQGTVYLAPEIMIGPYLLKDTKIAVLDFDMATGIDGLLGMNILTQFHFQIDQENKNLVLTGKNKSQGLSP